MLFRTLQVLGAYGFRGYFEKKPHFIQSVPYAIENLRQLLHNEYPEYPYLCSVLKGTYRTEAVQGWFEETATHSESHEFRL